MSSVINDAKAFLGQSLDEVIEALGPDVDPVPGDTYGQLDDLTFVHAPRTFPGVLYVRNDIVELVYVGKKALADVSPSRLANELGEDGVRLRSRAGQAAGLWVHAQHGIAYSAQGETLDFVEVFQPRTTEDYEAQIYREPGPFIG